MDRYRWAVGLWILMALGLGSTRAWGGESEGLLISYLERYHQLAEKDVEGRLALAQWCGYNQLFQQQADVLREVLTLQPGHITAYRDLLSADAKRVLPVDAQWAEKLEGLFGTGFKLHHSAHFTVASNADAEAVVAQAEAMEETYRVFYREAATVGLRPMPPAGRLVCVLFRTYEGYVDYLKRYEGEETGWSAGYYSWQTNRAAFFHDQDNPVFKEIRDKIAEVDGQIGDLRAEMDRTSGTAGRVQIQERLRVLTAIHADMTKRLGIAARLATNAKTRHEATHQLLFNSGIQRRGREYPFWLSEGLATLFELCDKEGHAGPKYVNAYRLKTWRDREQKGDRPSLGQLLSERPRANEEVEWVAGRYAQVWALVHFIWNKRPNELQSFLSELDAEGTPRDWVGFFKAHFGEDLDGLDREFRRYVESMHP
ncbi:MAG TPA: DUF1570 domain-containing protein [Tepidisphaeraceae bacterium]|nr:DUF1570 domain-containing protein [Tepidisphaeraceae bacterium]